MTYGETKQLVDPIKTHEDNTESENEQQTLIHREKTLIVTAMYLIYGILL